MVFDYWLLRRTRLDVEELYRPGPGGKYWFSNGYNWRALVAVAAGVIPVLPGFLNAATTEGGVVADPNFFDELYRYGVFVAFGISAVDVSRADARAAPRRPPRRRQPTEMDFGVTFQTDPPQRRVVELTKRAEELGFGYAWTFDSHILWQEPYVIYAQMLAATERIVVGPFVTNPATRDPTVTASLFATLNEGFGNRTICGIGRGDSARRVLGKKPTTLAADRGGDPRHQGARRGPRDRDAGRRGPDPVGASTASSTCGWRATGRRRWRCCGRKADGFILQLADPVILRWTVQHVRAAAEEAGRDPDEIAICVAAPAYLGDDLAHAREQCRWFGGMVGNHVADLVKRYGEGGDIPDGADRLHPRPRGLRLLPPRARREPGHGVRARRDRRPLLRARDRRGPRRQAARAASRSASTSSTSTSCTTPRRRRSTATASA